MARGPDFLSLISDAETLQLLLVACPDGIVVTDPGGKVILYTGASEQIFGYAPIEVLNQPVSRLFANPEEFDTFARRIAGEGRVVSMEMRATRRDDGHFWAAVSAALLRDRYGDTMGMAIYVRDHSRMRHIEAALREKNERLNELVEELDFVARHDALTGLTNRGSAMEAAEAALVAAEFSGKPFGVAIFDLDHFKAVNDSCGHLVGDEVLQAIGAVLRQATRQGDIVARFGGEEFIAFLPGAGPEQVAGFAERVRAAVTEVSIAVRDGELPRITISAGVAAIPSCAATLREAIRIADDRLYSAKRAGRNRVVASDAGQGRNAA